jgi:hypothetical protein
VYLSWRSGRLSGRHGVGGGRERRWSGRGVSRDDRRVVDGWRSQLGQQRLHGVPLAGLLRLLDGDLRRSRWAFSPYRRRRHRHPSTRRRLAQEPGKQGVQRLAPIVLFGFSRCGRDVGGDCRVSELDLDLARRRRPVSSDLGVDSDRFGGGRYRSVPLGLFVQVGCRFTLSHVRVRGLLAMQLDPLFERAIGSQLEGFQHRNSRLLFLLSGNSRNERSDRIKLLPRDFTFLSSPRRQVGQFHPLDRLQVRNP